MDFENIAKTAKAAALEIADISTDLKNKALLKIADNLEKNKTEIFEANKKDLHDAESLITSGEISKTALNWTKTKCAT